MISRLDIAKVIAEKTLVSNDTANLRSAIASYLLEEGRVGELDSLMREVTAYRAAHDHVEVTVVSAYPITSEVQKDVLREIKKQYPNAKTYKINKRIDPLVVGGLRIELAGEELDLTIQAKLNTFKRLIAARDY